MGYSKIICFLFVVSLFWKLGNLDTVLDKLLHQDLLGYNEHTENVSFILRYDWYSCVDSLILIITKIIPVKLQFVISL